LLAGGKRAWEKDQEGTGRRGFGGSDQKGETKKVFQSGAISDSRHHRELTSIQSEGKRPGYDHDGGE